MEDGNNWRPVFASAIASMYQGWLSSNQPNRGDLGRDRSLSISSLSQATCPKSCSERLTEVAVLPCRGDARRLLRESRRDVGSDIVGNSVQQTLIRDSMSSGYSSSQGKPRGRDVPGGSDDDRARKRRGTSGGMNIGSGGSSLAGMGALCAGGASGFHARPLWKLGGSGNLRGGWRRKDKKPRIMILMSDTGGGHRASAEALKAGFQHLYGDKYAIDIVDLWSHHTPWPYNEFPKSYSFMVKYPFIWRTNFNMTQPRLVHVPLATIMSAASGPSISEAFDKYNPNLIISVHPLMQHVPVGVLRRRIEAGLQDPNTKFATVVTDLTTCHNTWFYSDVDRCYVATEESRKQALGLGMPEEKIRVFGLPIRPAFSYGLPSKRALKKKLGLKADVPSIILVGGGEGMGPVEKTVDAVASQIGSQAQLVVVCGRNANLVSRLKKKVYPEGMNVCIQGFVTNMPDYMGACDIIITKAGPGTISEALICGLPLVLNAYVPCQEEGNIPYVTDNGVGVFETKPKKVAMIIKEWLKDDGEKLKILASKAKGLGKPDSLFQIVRDLSTMILPSSPGFRAMNQNVA